MVGDDQLARACGGDVPGVERHTIEGGKADVLGSKAVLGRRVQDGRAPQVAKAISEALERLVDLSLRRVGFALDVSRIGHCFHL